MRLSMKAYRHIKDILLSGSVKSDEWLSIDKISESLGSSRQPVMNALKRLKIEGYVEIVPQVGCRVRTPPTQEMEDFFRLFANGEALIAELAAQRALPNDIISLQLISAQIGNLTLTDEHDTAEGESYRILNRKLHTEMRRICRSPLLTDVIEGLADRSDFYIAISDKPVFALNINQAHEEHESIVRAIANHEPLIARKAMLDHIFATERRITYETEVEYTA